MLSLVPWAYWDPRRVYHATHVTLGAVAGRLHNGEVRIRATVTGVPAWLRQPPPVVKETDASFEAGSS